MIFLPWLLLTSRTLAELCVVVGALYFLIVSWRQQDWRWLGQRWVQAAALFFLYLVSINTPHSLHPADSLLHSLYFLRWPLFALALAHLLQNANTRILFLQSLALACAALMLDCVWQFVHGSDVLGNLPINARLTGPYHAPLPGIMLVRVLFIANLLLLLKPYKQPLALQSVVWLCALAVLLMTGERMAMLLYLLGIACISAAMLLSDGRQRKPLLWCMLIAVLMLAALLAAEPAIAQRMLWNLLDKLTHFAQSDYGRVFRAAFAAWQQQPWLGHGLHQYTEVCNAMGLLPSWGMFCSHPHNLYLLLAAESGLIGLALFAAMVVLMYWQTCRPLYQQRQWLLLGNTLAILTVCFFPLIGGISVWSNWVAALVWTGVGVGLSLSQQPR